MTEPKSVVRRNSRALKESGSTADIPSGRPGDARRPGSQPRPRGAAVRRNPSLSPRDPPPTMRLSRILLSVVLLVANARSFAGGFDFEAMRSLIDSRGIHTVEDLVAALPSDLRSHYALVFASRSLQASSFRNPRAILFGSDARFIISFNGAADQRGYAAVETMEFDPASNSFRFREVAFASGPDGTPNVGYSAANPARCVACHGRPARPIWDTAPEWPGAYGERYHAGLSSAESAGIRQFLGQATSHPRYGYLEYLQAFADRETYVPSSRAVYNGEIPEPPNARLSTLLAALNVRAIISELAARPAFEAHRYVLLAAAGSNCGPLEEFYPASVRAALGSRLARFAAAAISADRHQATVKSLRQANAGGGRRNGGRASDLTALRFVAETGLGVSTREWTLALEKATYDFATPGGVTGLDDALFEWVASNDPELRDVAAFRTFAVGDSYCSLLQRRSVSALDAWYAANPGSVGGEPASCGLGCGAPSDALVADSGRPALLDRCVACHTSDVAPPLPFGDAAQLERTLSKAGYPRGRLLDEILFRLTPEAGTQSMPLGLNITDAERRDLEEYFLILATRSTVDR